jgi:hypothetical protein
MKAGVLIAATACGQEETGDLIIETGIQRFGNWWCKLIHDAPSWPIHNQYECRTCGRRHHVLW